MGTRMLLFPGEEHMHRAPSWGGMHDPDVGNPPWMSAYSPSSGGNTWSKRLAASSSTNDSDSWEVRAFAEDASTSGQWPPRSYSCSFCQREFRTAQALGGHMNVHRRERAQANQLAQLRSTGTEPHHNPHSHQNSQSHNVAIPSTLPQEHHPHHHWLPRETQHGAGSDHHYGTSYASPPVEDSYHPGSSYGAPPSSSFRNSSPYDASPWRSSYETSSRDSGLDLELRLGQRYD